MKKYDISYIISAILVSLSFAYPEMILAMGRGFNMETYVLENSLLLALSLGLLFVVVFGLFMPQRFFRVIGIIVSEAAAFFYTVEYFLDETYSAFMSISSISVGAGGVLASYKDLIMNVIRNGWKDILLFQAVPLALILFTVLFRKFKNAAQGHIKGIVAMLAISCMIMSVISIGHQIEYEPRYTYEYSFTDAVKSFGLSNALYLDVKYTKNGVPEAPRSIYGGKIYYPDDLVRNELDVDWDAMKKAAEGTDKELIVDILENTYSTEKNEFTGMFQGKNLVQITIESFSEELLDTGYFPLLKRMADNGIVIKDYYHPFWGGSTISGEAAVISGLLPTAGAASMQNMIGKNNGYTLTSDFNKLGYRTVAYHNGDEYYYNRTDTHPAVGFSEFYSDGTGMESYLISGEWPRSDLDMFRYIIDDMEANYDGNFYLYIMTFSGHGLYNFSGNEISVKNHELLKGSKYYDLWHIGGYVSCSLDFELGLELFCEYLEEKGLLEDTVFVMTDDHYPYALQKGSAWHNDVNYLTDLYGYEPVTQPQRDHNSLIIWSPFLETLDEDDKIIVEDPAYALDIVPTMKNLFGIEYESRMFTGRDILSDSEPLVIWANSSWMTDKGYYDSTSGVFTSSDPSETVSTAYIDSIKQKVRDKMSVARSFVNTDFYDFYSQYLTDPAE
ncbi:MAG: LTA synthase family protein [Firmicutes bacterium]|nr:LTA synthase family protein [Bacillota bacterium]